MTVQQYVFQGDVMSATKCPDLNIATSEFLAWHNVSISLEPLFTPPVLNSNFIFIVLCSRICPQFHALNNQLSH